MAGKTTKNAPAKKKAAKKQTKVAKQAGVRIVVVKPVPGVTYAVQRGRSEFLAPARVTDTSLVFEFTLIVADTKSDPPRLTGPYAHTDTSSASRPAIADLAVGIGLIKPPDPVTGKQSDESSLRQLMKFARTATRAQAKQLSEARIAWRAVVVWIGIKDAGQRSKLYNEMVSGLTNSTKIRGFIADRFKNPAKPRSHVDLARNMANAQEVADRLVESLRNLNGRLEAKVATGEDITKREKSRLKSSLRRLDDAVKEAARLARAAGAIIGRSQ